MLPVVSAPAALRPCGRLFRGIRHAVGAFLSGSALRSARFHGFHRYYGLCWLPVPVARRGVSPGKNALLPGTTAAFTSAAEPVGFAVLCQLARRVGLGMRLVAPCGRCQPSAGRSSLRSGSVRRPAGFR